MTSTDKPGLAICLRILSGVLFAGMLICVKLVSADVPLGEIVFYRSAFALIPLVIFLWVRREFPSGLATKRPIRTGTNMIKHRSTLENHGYAPRCADSGRVTFPDAAAHFVQSAFGAFARSRFSAFTRRG